MRAGLPVWESLVLLGPDSGGGGRGGWGGGDKSGTHKSVGGGAANTERNVSLRPFPLRVGLGMMNRRFL